MSGDIAAFSERFGLEVHTVFNMTEISSPIVSEPNPTARGTRGEIGEEDVIIVVAPVQGQTIDPAELLECLRARMARFMVPRCVRIVPEPPKTPTAKVQKNQLRAMGVAPDTWDRERAGINVRMDGLGKGKS